MKYKFCLILPALVLTIKSFAQIITIRGQIVDKTTHTGIPGASVLSGNFGTSADENGNFVFYIQQTAVEESGITARCIGYQTVHITDFTDNFELSMEPAPKELKEVRILSGAEGIVQKAYRQIGENYVSSSLNMIGLEHTINSVRDTFGYQYYFTSKAKLKIYMSPYGTVPVIYQVGLTEKQQEVESNPAAARINFFNGMVTAQMNDYVHRRNNLVKGKTSDYTYKLNLKEIIGGRKVYVINFYSKAKSQNAGILYIDTASYAFVRILYNRYNVKIDNAIKQDKMSLFIQYRPYGDKWALDAVKNIDVTNHNGCDLDRMDEFQAAVITTENAAELPLDAIIKPSQRTSDELVQPYKGFSRADRKIPKNIEKLADSTFAKSLKPKIANRVH